MNSYDVLLSIHFLVNCRIYSQLWHYRYEYNHSSVCTGFFMFNLVLAHVNNFGIYFIENKLDFVSFDDKNPQRGRKFVGERDFPTDFHLLNGSSSMSESQQGPGICDVISAKRYFEGTF